MRIDILTIFPEIFPEPLKAGLLGKAWHAGVVDIRITDIRNFAADKHRTVDDAPFGGGPGMVMKCEPVFAAVESLRPQNSCNHILLLSARGERFTHATARALAAAPDVILICGRYEGIDERVSQGLAAKEISIGDFVLSGGEFAALVVVDAVARLLPGVVGDYGSVATDSFYDGILGPPQYTRPGDFRGMTVPQVLTEGDHAAIERFRRIEALRATALRRPDLLANLSKSDRALLRSLNTDEDLLVPAASGTAAEEERG